MNMLMTPVFWIKTGDENTARHENEDMRTDISKGFRVKKPVPVFNIRKRGSLSLETALVLPLFMFGMLLLLSFLSLMEEYMSLEQAIYTEAKLLGIKVCEGGSVDDERIGREVSEIFLNESGNKNKGIINTDETDFSESKYENNEILTIDAGYRAKLPFDMEGIFDRELSNRIVIHAFTGYEKGLDSMSDRLSDEYVYMTENGTVYHRNPDCTHIRLKIHGISSSELESARNNNGGRYKPCELCHAKKSDPYIYITPEGDRFHNSFECSGLKRTVRMVKLSDIPGVPPCSRCGGKN
ncbi:MAG: hypothetical protein K6B28_03175 [Lachnospiraceae bacterium]|nr:hypothetical protein [Lachnospiraceae bacterium]